MLAARHSVGLIWTFAGSQLDHAFPETDGSERSQNDTAPTRFEFRRPPTEAARTLEDTAPTRFGTVRPWLQIPGPDQFLNSDS